MVFAAQLIGDVAPNLRQAGGQRAGRKAGDALGPEAEAAGRLALLSDRKGPRFSWGSLAEQALPFQGHPSSSEGLPPLPPPPNPLFPLHNSLQWKKSDTRGYSFLCLTQSEGEHSLTESRLKRFCLLSTVLRLK